jgi:hypothetical protein
MASAASNLRSTCGSDRRPPECSTQRRPTGDPQVGHGTEASCLRVSSFLPIRTDCSGTSRKAVPFWTFFGSYPTRKRVTSKCLTSILPHPPRNTRLLAKSDGVAGCGCSLERRCNARGVELGRKTTVSKLRKHRKFPLASEWPARKISPRAHRCTPISLPELWRPLLCVLALR